MTDVEAPVTYDCSRWDDWPKKNTRPGKAWKAVYRYHSMREGMTPDEAYSAVQSAAVGLSAPVIDGSRVTGWIPMSPQEQAQAERRAAAAAKSKATRAARDRAADLAKIASLAKKHGLTIPAFKEGR